VLCLVLVIVDVSHIWHRSRLDPEILKLLQLHANTPSVLVLNKVLRSVSLSLMALTVCDVQGRLHDSQLNHYSLMSCNVNADLQFTLNATVGKCRDARQNNCVFDLGRNRRRICSPDI